MNACDVNTSLVNNVGRVYSISDPIQVSLRHVTLHPLFPTPAPQPGDPSAVQGRQRPRGFSQLFVLILMLQRNCAYSPLFPSLNSERPVMKIGFSLNITMLQLYNSVQLLNFSLPPSVTWRSQQQLLCEKSKNSHIYDSHIGSDRRKTIFKFVQKRKGSQITKNIMRKKSRAGRLIVSDFGLYCKATVIKKYCIGTKTNTQINGTELRTQK